VAIRNRGCKSRGYKRFHCTLFLESESDIDSEVLSQSRLSQEDQGIKVNTVKLRYEALNYDTITDMSRWARGPQGIFQGVQYVKYLIFSILSPENLKCEPSRSAHDLG